MPRNVYHEINLHIVWRTKGNTPVLVDHVENRCHHYVAHRAGQSPGVVVHVVNGTEDHIHVAVSVPPTLLVSEWIGQLKGASSHYINHEICNAKVLDWQAGYGVVSFGTKDLPWVMQYIQAQKQHHAVGTTHDRLEQIERPEDRGSGVMGKPVETG
jgi:putative transposase